MHKSVFIFQNVKHPERFENFIKNDVIPNLVKVPELLHLNVTKIYPIADGVSDVLLHMDTYIEVYFESFEVIDEIWSSGNPQALKVTQMILENPYAEAGLFLSKEVSIPVRHNLEGMKNKKRPY